MGTCLAAANMRYRAKQNDAIVSIMFQLGGIPFQICEKITIRDRNDWQWVSLLLA